MCTDMNGDRSLAREELSHCLKGCMYLGYGIDSDEIDECERDIIEIGSVLYEQFLYTN